MSRVELVSNPSPDISTHRLHVTGLRFLNRKNKLSSLPFWVPNHVMKHHQFRILFIRGIVRHDRPCDDAIGVLLELIPPPPGSDAAFPGGCNVTARVVNRLHEADRAYDIQQTEMTHFTESSLQVGFPDLIAAHVLDNPEFVEGGENLSLTLEVTIQTGVNVAAEHVARTVSSAWASFSKQVGRIIQKAVHAYNEPREECGGGPIYGGGPPVPWEAVPPSWAAAGRAADWRRIVAEQLVDDEGTFRYGPSRGLTSDEQAILLQCGLNQRLIMNSHTQFDFDRDVHEGLLTLPGLRQQRYHLVPGRMKEEDFWSNYYWKVAALAQCQNDEQVRLLLTVINAPPAVKARDVTAARSVDEETVLAHVADAQEAADMLIEYITEGTDDVDFLVEAAATACEGHAKQLEGYFKRTDLSESTLEMTGVVLKRLRERLAERAAYIAKRGSHASHSVDGRVEAEISVDSKSHNSGKSIEEEAGEKKHKEAEEAEEEEEEEEKEKEKEKKEGKGNAKDPKGIEEHPPSVPIVSTGKVEFSLMPWEEEEAGEG